MLHPETWNKLGVSISQDDIDGQTSEQCASTQTQTPNYDFDVSEFYFNCFAEFIDKYETYSYADGDKITYLVRLSPSYGAMIRIKKKNSAIFKVYLLFTSGKNHVATEGDFRVNGIHYHFSPYNPVTVSMDSIVPLLREIAKIGENHYIVSMSKKWLEDHIDLLSDEELLESGFSQENINTFRDCFGKKTDLADIEIEKINDNLSE